MLLVVLCRPLCGLTRKNPARGDTIFVGKGNTVREGIKKFRT
jgi:hypothetical protein